MIRASLFRVRGDSFTDRSQKTCLPASCGQRISIRATRWHPCDAAPAWPYPRNCATGWQDVYGFPPAAVQSIWLRRYPEDTAAFRATFDANNLTFTLPTGWQLCWFDAWKWKA